MAWRKKVSECNHPDSKQKWSSWRNALTRGRQYRRKRCMDCGHYTGSENRPKP